MWVTVTTEGKLSCGHEVTEVLRYYVPPESLDVEIQRLRPGPLWCNLCENEYNRRCLQRPTQAQPENPVTAAPAAAALQRYLRLPIQPLPVPSGNEFRLPFQVQAVPAPQPARDELPVWLL